MIEFQDKITDHIKKSPFVSLAGFKLTKLEKGLLEGSINLMPMFRRYDKIAHGGFLSYFCDSLMGLSSLTMIDYSKQTAVTAEMKVTYLNPGAGEILHGTGRVIKSGKTIIFCESEVYGIKPDGERYIVCKASATMCVINKKINNIK